MSKPKGLYRLPGLRVNAEIDVIAKDICKFAKTVSGKEYEPKETGWLRWLVLRWPAVKRYLDRIALQKRESESLLGDIHTEFGGQK